MRLRWCRLALLGFLRRWGIYLVVLAAAVGAGAIGAWQIITALAAWLVLPLFYAAGHGAWLIAALALQTLASAGCIWGMRALLWPPQWAEAERALPILRRDTWRSDAFVVLLGLLPLMLLYGVGAVTLLGQDPLWLRPSKGRAVLALVAATAASIGVGVALLQALRQSGNGRLRRRGTRFIKRGLGAKDAPRVASWPRVLLWLPLWRGPAQRSGHGLWLGAAVLCLPGLGLWVWSSAAGWWLAAFAALALLAVTRVNSLLRLELTPLLDACKVLPLSQASLHRARSALPLLLVLPGTALLLSGLIGGLTSGLTGGLTGGLFGGLPIAEVRPAVLAAYFAVCMTSCVVEVFSSPRDAAAKASRWLFSLVLSIALATEVVR